MGYDRYPRGTNPQGDYYNRSETQDYGRDYGSGRDYSYSSAREYEAAGRMGDDRDGGRGGYGRDGGERERGYGARDYGYQRYGQRERFSSGQYGGQSGGQYGGQDRGYGRRETYGGGSSGGGSYSGGREEREYHGSYGSDGRRFEDVGRNRHADDDNYRGGQRQQRSYGGQPQGHDREERGFFDRAGDEVRSWFGDDEAERRREMDQRYDERAGRAGRTRHDDDYHSWRSTQIAALDRDYDEYRRENRSKFHNDFSSWRTQRQTQRQAMNAVKEHQEVVGSDGEHVGTVDKVRGDRIILTKNDQDAGGRHHSVPCSWITSVDDKVVLNKSAEEAKQAWRDEERNQAMFGDDDAARASGEAAGQSGDQSGVQSGGQQGLNRSFSGTY